MNAKPIVGFIGAALASAVLTSVSLGYAAVHWRRMYASLCVADHNTTAYYGGAVDASGDQIFYCPLISGDDFDVGSVTEVQVEVFDYATRPPAQTCTQLCALSHTGSTLTCGNLTCIPVTSGYHLISISDSTNLTAWSTTPSNYPYVYVGMGGNDYDTGLLGYKVID